MVVNAIKKGRAGRVGMGVGSAGCLLGVLVATFRRMVTGTLY